MKYFQMTLLLLMLGHGSCVERYISITTKPAGAIVWLNDEEVGATPVTVPFTWYGEYEVVVRKDGYETLKTSQQADAPVYQWIGFDFVAECLLPMTFVDRHNWEFSLIHQVQPDSADLIQRAQSTRTEALEGME